MGNIIDYLKWRGDLTLEVSPFNEVDNLILAHLSYVNLDGIAPGRGEGVMSVEELSRSFFQKHSPEELAKDKTFLKDVPQVLRAMGDSRRFGQAVVKNYVNHIDTQQEVQFAALEIDLEDGTAYIAYRGTDDTIVGWKEDFNLSKGVVTAELEAVEYLDQVGAAFAGDLRVGGHSKGGNLAVFAASRCTRAVQDKLLTVYDNDGPGFSQGFLAQEGFLQVCSRIRRIIPECSVIGMLLDHAVEPEYVASSETGILQHNGLSWQVLGTEFVREKALNKKAALFNKTLDGWLHNMDQDRRNAVIEDFFGILEATGARTLTELQNGGLKTISVMLGHLDSLGPETRSSVEELVKDLIGHWHEFI